MTPPSLGARVVTPSLRIHSQGALPIYLQLKHQLSYLITTNRLPGGMRLPTVRALAAELDINQHTVGQAYRELQQEGLIEAFAGRGTFVRRFDEASAAKSARLEQLSVILRKARKQARALGFDDVEIEQHLGSLVHHEVEPCQVVFVDRYRHIAEKYASRLDHHVGAGIRTTALTIDDVAAARPVARGALAIAHFVFAFARNVPALERALGADEAHEIVTIVSEVVPSTVAALEALPANTRSVLMTEERFVHAALDLIARHGRLEPATVRAFTSDQVEGFVAAAADADVAFYTFGVSSTLRRVSLRIPTQELVFDVSPDSVTKVRAMLT